MSRVLHRNREVESKYNKGNNKLRLLREISCDPEIGHGGHHGAKRDHENDQEGGPGRTQTRGLLHVNLRKVTGLKRCRVVEDFFRD